MCTLLFKKQISPGKQGDNGSVEKCGRAKMYSYIYHRANTEIKIGDSLSNGSK
jgi:hypothetical protein